MRNQFSDAVVFGQNKSFNRYKRNETNISNDFVLSVISTIVIHS